MMTTMSKKPCRLLVQSSFFVAMLLMVVVTTTITCTTVAATSPTSSNSGEGGTATTTLTFENYNQMIQGKRVVLIKFYTPWCPNSKRLSPIWDKLAKELTGCDAEEDDLDIDSSSSSSSFLIGQVDCKKQSKLCRQHDIVNFPTIKYGFLESPTASAAAASNDGTSSPNLIEYQGSHDYDDLKEFVELLLQQPCTTTDSESNTTGTNCSNEQREFLDKLQHESSLNDIELMIEQEETLLKQIYLDFELSVDTKFQQQYTTLTQTRDDELISIRQDMDILKSMISVKERNNKEKEDGINNNEL